MKNSYERFEKMMYEVAEDIVMKNHQPDEVVNITCSGGLDSLSTVLAIGRYTNKINLVHWNRGRGRYDDTLTQITKYIADSKGYSVQMIKGSDEVYKELNRAGVKKFVFSDGFDISFSEIYEIYPDTPGYPYGKTLSFSYGESFRSRHPIIDVVAHLPDRITAWNCSKDVSGYERIMSNIYLEKKYRDREGLNIEVIDYDSHPKFVDFFFDYYTPFSDIFDRKRYCSLFIKRNLGISHRELTKKAVKSIEVNS